MCKKKPGGRKTQARGPSKTTTACSEQCAPREKKVKGGLSETRGHKGER